MGSHEIRKEPEPMSGDVQLVQPYAGGKIVLKTFARFGGAIGSLTWNGVEFVDSHDKGRLWQVSTHFSTPTNGNAVEEDEAGMASDPAGKSTTGIIGVAHGANWVHTKVDPSLYFGGGKSRDTITEKVVTLGLPGHPNVIDWKMTVRLLTEQQNVTVEAPTCYLPPAFNKFYTYSKGAITPFEATKDGVWSAPGPLVVEDTAKKTALGFIGLSPSPTYAAWLNCLGANTTKLATYCHKENPGIGPQFYHTQLVVGPTQNVVATMKTLLPSA